MAEEGLVGADGGHGGFAKGMNRGFDFQRSLYLRNTFSSIALRTRYLC